jgi:uncharacterized cupin superfamily protein
MVSKKIRADQAPTVHGTRYPAPYDAPCRERVRHRLGDAVGLTQFGVNLLRLPPGSWSSQRHWHQREDEFAYVVEGELVLVTDAGEELLRRGDWVAFKAGVRDGHHLQNRTDREAVLLEVGTRAGDAEVVEYPDIDLRLQSGRWLHRDGAPYPAEASPAAAAGRK